MNANDYQHKAMYYRNADDGVQLVNAALGLAGESGEIADIIKKGTVHGHWDPEKPDGIDRHGQDKEKLVYEAGDVLWYIAQLLDALGVSMSQAMEMNLAKLEKRYTGGFSREASMKRGEE